MLIKIEIGNKLWRLSWILWTRFYEIQLYSDLV